MSGFKALNIESDDESDIEVDDTKEIQIEEALKLYQTALKYHADGPERFPEAAEAYRLLFESDIFKYPESQAELKRLDLYGSATSDADWTLPNASARSFSTKANLDNGPSTLPQILHLSHKNYAQFKLDALSARFDTFNLTLRQTLVEASAALDHFVDALDKDDTDLDLWRRTAAVGEILDSKRIARFCLEAVLEGDDDGLSGIWSQPGLEEGFARDHLRSLIVQLQDQLSLIQIPLSTGKRRVLSKLLKDRLRPYHAILDRRSALEEAEHQSNGKDALPSRDIFAPQTWSQLGEVLIHEVMGSQHETSVSSRQPTIRFTSRLAIEQQTMDHSPESLPDSPSPQLLRNAITVFPSLIAEIFPGLDAGEPTVQPRLACADASMDLTNLSSVDRPDEGCQSPTLTLPTRKRSGDTAGITEGSEEVRTKSRRIRARDSIAEAQDNRQAVIEANIRWEHEQKLAEIQAIDDWVYETVGTLFEKIDIVGFDAARHVRQDMSTSENVAPDAEERVSLKPLQTARSDIQACLENWSDHQAMVMLMGDEAHDERFSATSLSINGIFSSTGSPKSRTTSRPMPDADLPDFLQSINDCDLLIHEIAWAFIIFLLRPTSKLHGASYYDRYTWPEDLKTPVVKILVGSCDTYLFDSAREKLAQLQNLGGSIDDDQYARDALENLATIIQGLFELHLDVYTLIKAPNSDVGVDIVSAQRHRLTRWSTLCGEMVQFRNSCRGGTSSSDRLNLRFLWATTFHMNTEDDISQEHVIGCMKDLRSLWVAADNPTILLPNNAAMSELSVSALDNEMMRITTRDFFSRISDQREQDPVGDIETLEPLLDVLETAGASEDIDATNGVSSTGFPPDLLRLLTKSGIPLRLKLLQNLRKAYKSIDFDPMVVRCYFRMIHALLEEIKDASSAENSQSDRRTSTMQNIKLIRLFVKEIFGLVHKKSENLDCMDDTSLKLAVNGLGEVLQLVQVYNVFGDSIRVGQSQPPAQSNGSPFESYKKVMNTIDEMQVHMWIILYELFKEVIVQNREQYTTPDEDRFEFLRTVHRDLGIRGICGAANRVLVRLLKDEFFSLTHVDGYDNEQAQVLYDLYDLNCFLKPTYELIEHHCTHDAFLDRSVANQAVDLLLMQASKLPMKELVKHPLKDTIEKVHGSVARKKPTDAVMRNREVYRAFTRSPVQPMDLFNCLKGEGNQLPVVTVPREDAHLAFKGWYFLMGNIALTRFRAQKRTAAAPTEDLDIAIAFFNQGLEATMDHWETWFRLAQAYDSKVEESVVWSAEKLNNNMADVVQLQRSAIHCYTMATALAYRSADPTFETAEKMTELYADFAMRLYSSSREPFGMLPFANDENERFVSVNHGIDKQKAFEPLSAYTVWKLAKVLFKRAIAGNANSWSLHYMVGKCLWKMHSTKEGRRRHDVPPSGQEVLQAFVRALDLLPPDKKDSRDTKREPNLEPHYKLASIVHKLVQRGSISLDEAKEALEHTKYARVDEFPTDLSEWTPYILKVMKNLRTADKSNWYHRMIARAAHIVHEDTRNGDDEESKLARAQAAKHELTQQMFTKTMVLQVWRPEGERAGRHFVYTARYTRFFVDILEQLNDRANLELLARKVRRRPHDVFEHGAVWQGICMAYLKLLRAHANLDEGLETSTFSNIAHEDFLARKDVLTQWMQVQDTGQNAALDVLREVSELKKINQSLMKPGYIDDLIGDSYAHLFLTVGKQLWEGSRRQQQQEEDIKPAVQPSTRSPPRNPVMNLNHLMNVETKSEVSSTSSPAPAPAAATATDAAAPARRKIGVGRREIRAAADACLQKPSAAVPGSAAKGGVGSARSQSLTGDANRLSVPGDSAMDVSAPGSIHDSADESELSELEEDSGDEDEMDKGEEAPPVRKLMFPGLVSSPTEDAREEAEEFETADEGNDNEAEDGEMEVETAGFVAENAGREDPAMDEDNDEEEVS